jgi:hypothetical protein
VKGDAAELVALEQQHGTERGLAEPRCICQHSFKYRLELPGRTRDHSQHVGGSGLLLQRCAKFVEQAGVLDGDNSLRREIAHQFDLFVREGACLLTINSDYTNDLAVFDHRHIQ